MSIAPVKHTALQCVSSGTTSAVDNTGANLLVATIQTSFGNSPTLSDSSGNTWTQIGSYQAEASNTCQVGLFFSLNPTVTVSQTFSLASANFSSLEVASFSGVISSNALGGSSQAQDATSSHITLQPGSLTPSTNGCLLVTAATPANAVSVSSIDSGFSITDNEAYNSGVAVAGALAYLVQGSAAPINPTWTFSAAFGGAAIMAYFKPAAATPVVVTPALNLALSGPGIGPNSDQFRAQSRANIVLVPVIPPITIPLYKNVHRRFFKATGSFRV